MVLQGLPTDDHLRLIETSSAETVVADDQFLVIRRSARAMPIRCRWPPENSCG
jgi:hypothetical protein